MRTIWLQGVKVKVQDNLYAALQRLREDKVDRSLWIDAICVNQNDNNEKAQQVPLMAEIFRNARQVLIWLGPGISYGEEQADEGASKADEAASKTNGGLPVAYQSLKDMASLEPPKDLKELPYFHEHTVVRPYGRRLREHGSLSNLMESLRTIMNAEWFTRTWTIQEIVLARDAVVQYDKHRIDWQIIKLAWKQWNKHINTCCKSLVSRLDREDLHELRMFSGKVCDLSLARESLELGIPPLRGY
jgi:hypothetical protein